MDNKENIRELLDKYLEGMTTLEEEQFLKDYFKRDDVPKEFKSEAHWFENASEQNVPEHEVQNLQNVLSQWVDKQEQHERKIRLKIWTMSIAAGVALLIGAFFLFQNYRSASSRDTYQDPEVAYLEAKKVLLYVSQTLNKGTDKLQNISRIDEGSNEMSIFSTFGSGLKDLEMVSKYNDQVNKKQ